MESSVYERVNKMCGIKVPGMKKSFIKIWFGYEILDALFPHNLNMVAFFLSSDVT
jgi:hypothetical protein